MATTIQIKRSSTASGVPLATDLAVGELAVNLADKRLFTKQSDGTIIELSTNPTDLDAATLRIDGVEITASATELNSLDGFTGSTAELNLLDGLTATTIELNTLDGITASTAELNKLDGYTGSTAELNILDGVTATTAELNKLDGFTGTVADLNYAKDLRATGVTTTEFDKLDGLTATTTELNYTDGVTSNIQTQLNGKAATTTSPTITLAGDLSGSATLTNLGSATLTATVADDSHNHVISNVDGLQTALDSKANLSGANFTGSVDVTGTVTADGLTVDGDSAEVKFSETASSSASVVFQEASERLSKIKIDISSPYINTDYYSQGLSGGWAGRHRFFTSDNGSTALERLRILNNGDVSFYEDTGTTAKMVWDASAESLGIGTASPSSAIHVKGGSTTTSTSATDFIANSTARLVANHANEYGAYIGYINSSNDAIAINSMRSNGVGAPLSLNTFGGNVGIGTASPERPLHIASATPYIVFEETDANQKFSLGSGGGKFFVYDETDSVQRFTIDGSGNVGIGTASPSERLDVRGSVNGTHAMFSGQTGRGLVIGTENTLNNDDGVSYNAQTSSGKHLFKTNGSERARIDSSGNLLVGTTDTTLYNSTSSGGVLLDPNGPSTFARSGASPCLQLNKTDSDGGVLTFRKAGVEVGSIGIYASQYLTIGTGDSGLLFQDVANEIIPRAPSGSVSDDNLNLGASSSRFKDLYLSGGVYLGGTGAANKLDDYEEGDFTLTLSGSTTAGTQTSGSSGGKYTRVGNIVTCTVFIANTTLSGASGKLKISGFPFVPNNYAGRPAVGFVRTYNQNLSSPSDGYFSPTISIEAGGSYGYIVQSKDDNAWYLADVDNQSSLYIEGTIIYHI